MGITDKLPLLNSKSKPVKIVGYVVYAFIALIILAALSGPAPTAEVKGDDTAEVKGDDTAEQSAEKEEECIDDVDYSIRAEDVLMQTGYFKKVNFITFKGDRIKVEVEPSSLANSDAGMFEAFIFAAIEQAPACLGIKNVEVIAKLDEVNMRIRYPFSAAALPKEVSDWRIEQK